MSDVMGIIHFGRAWGVHEGGMLKRNGLIIEDDWKKLEAWVEIISYTFTLVLDIGENSEAFADYEFYLDEEKEKQAQQGSGGNA